MDIAGRKIAILTHNFFEQSELEEPLKALKKAGAEVVVISAAGMKLQALNHIEKGDLFQADLLLSDASSEDYEALILPGGVVNSDKLRTNNEAQFWAIDFLQSRRTIAAICHAPWLLVSADLVENRRLTSYHSIKDDITNAGGQWIDRDVVVDNNLITCRTPEDMPKFIKSIIESFTQTSDHQI